MPDFILYFRFALNHSVVIKSEKSQFLQLQSWRSEVAKNKFKKR